MDLLKDLKAVTEYRKSSLLVFLLLIIVLNLVDSASSPQVSIDSLVNKSALLVILDTSLTMDRSDSSNKPRLSRAIESISGLLARVRPEDIVALRTFSTFTNLVIPPLSRESLDVAVKLSEIEVLASSDIGAALRAAMDDIEKFRKETKNLIPWTCILITDGKGDDSDKDVAVAKEFSTVRPILRCHVIGIDVPHSKGDELRSLASLMNGNCWTTGPGEFSEAFDAAVFLAGFQGSAPVNKNLFLRDSKTAGMPVFALLLSAIIVMGLRTRVSEGKFLVLLSVFAAILAWASWMYLLPGSQDANLQRLDSLDSQYAAVILILKNMGRMAVHFMMVGVIFGVAMTVSESLYLASGKRALEKAAAVFPLAMWGGMLAGAMAQLLFVTVRGGTYTLFSSFFGDDGIPGSDSYFWTVSQYTNILARSIGWGIGGAIIGACPGVGADSVKKIKNGLIGGVSGGVIGGYFFENVHTQALGGDGIRLMALTATGIAIAIMIRVVEEYRKEAWLVIEKGGPVGKSFVIDKAHTVLGSHYKCDVVVGKKVGVEARPEAEITTDGKIYTIRPSKGAQVMINGQVVASHELSQGDGIEIAAGKLSFNCRFSRSTLSRIEEDLLLPRTHNSKQKSVPVNEDGDRGGNIPLKKGIVKSEVDVGDDRDCIIELGALEVAGRKIDKS